MCGAGSALRPHGRQPKACATGQTRTIYSLVKPPRRLRALPPGACGDAPFKGLLCDLDGVLFSADQAIPGAVEAIEWMKSQSVPTLFLTNNSTTSRAGMVEKLQGLGFRCEKNQVLTPATVAAQYIQKHHQNSRTALFVDPALEAEFEQADVQGSRDGAVSAVVLGDMGRGFNYESMNRAFRLLMSVSEPELIALGKARYFQDHDGLSLDVGPFAQALEFASGRKAHVLGKPAVEFFHIGAELLGEAPEALVMVGDDVRSDVGGAQAAGLRGILVRTGKFKPDDLAQGITPHAVIDSIADLPAWWQDHAMQKAT